MSDETPTRGEVWLVRLPRAVGAELQRDRPAVVVSSPAFDASPVRIIVPLTTWQDGFAEQLNKFLIPATNRNGLQADSAADFLQVRSVSTERLMRRVGVLRGRRGGRDCGRNRDRDRLSTVMRAVWLVYSQVVEEPLRRTRLLT